MKYIRTKDAIYETHDNIVLASLPPKYEVKADGAIKYISETEVIGQADDILSMFDLVSVESADRTEYFGPRYFAELFVILCNRGYRIRGVIWSGGGFNTKAVAELNENTGEWKLL